MRRGRSNDTTIAVGDHVDFWRVSAFEPDRKLTLAAEMKVPGRAWLDFEVESTKTGATIRQTAIFDPVGLFGLLYWYLSFLLHQWVFGGMLRGIAAAAMRPDHDLSTFFALTVQALGGWRLSTDKGIEATRRGLRNGDESNRLTAWAV